jgi:hypothetical protein
MRKLIAAVALLLGIVVASPGSAGAGGWVVVSFDEQPALVAGEPTDIGFTVLRHGVTPETNDDIMFVLTDARGARHEFAATPAGARGHHVVTIDVPTDGEYRLTVLGEFVDVDLGPIAIGAGSDGSSSTWRWDALQWGTASLALVLACLAGWDVLRSRRPARTSIAA